MTKLRDFAENTYFLYRDIFSVPKERDGIVRARKLYAISISIYTTAYKQQS